MRALGWSMIFVMAVACASATGDEAPEVVTGGDGGHTAAGAGGAAGGSAGAGDAGAGGASLPDGGSFPDGSAQGGAAGKPEGGSGGQAQAGQAQAGQAQAGQAQAGQAQAGQAQAGQAQAGQAGAPSGPCAGKVDGDVCAPTTAVCKSPGLCAGGVCQAIANKADGTICDDPKSPCQQPGTCSAGVCGAPKPRPDDYVYDSSSHFSRCCGGVAVKVTSNTNCGACGIGCNASNGEACAARSNAGQTNYYCAGCVASAGCWSGCCSTSNPATMNVCAASDCKGGCTTKCPKGTHCQAGASVMMSNWCEPD